MRLLFSFIPFIFLIHPFPCKGEYKFKVGYYTQPVDHFNFLNNNTFQMKYLINDDNWKGGNAPIFFYTGNEGDIELFAQNSGFIWESSPEFGALILFAEHRYYGSSLPFGNDSFNPGNIGYLTSEQALADYADFLTWFRSARPGAASSPIIAFGGSYGGMLTAWMRMKYPHVIQGGIAASAPILFFINVYKCGRFEKVVTQDFQKVSHTCSESIRNSWDHLNALSKSDAGRQWISRNWKLCKPLEKESDIESVKGWLSSTYAYLAMSDYPYPANFIQPLPGNPINVFCRGLRDPSAPDKKLLRSLFGAISVYFNYTGSAECLDISVENSGLLGDKAWDFQACTEMIMPQCSDGVNDFFEPTKWDLNGYIRECQRKWGVIPRPNQAYVIYGGRDIGASSNIIFSNGLLDPWYSGGVLTNISDSLLSIIIPEGAHHLDLRASDYRDPHSVIRAREFEKDMIRKWIGDYNRDHPPKFVIPQRKKTLSTTRPTIIKSNEIPQVDDYYEESLYYEDNSELLEEMDELEKEEDKINNKFFNITGILLKRLGVDVDKLNSTN